MIRISAASLNQTPMDWSGNIENITNSILQAKELNCSFLCLPEMCLTGYGCEDWFLSPDLSKTAFNKLITKILPLTENIVVLVGLPFWHNSCCFNGVAVLTNKKLLGIVFKKNLCHDGIHYESRWFKAWRPGSYDIYYAAEGNFFGDIPIGDLCFNVNDIKFGFEICEDAWVADRPGHKLVHRQVDIIFNPSASHFSFNKSKTRRSFIVEGSRAFNCTYVYANLLGNESGRIIFDGDCYIASNGEMKSSCERFSFEKFNFCFYDIDVDILRQKKATLASYDPTKEINNLPELVSFNSSLPTISSDFYNSEIHNYPVWEINTNKIKYDSKLFEEFTRSVMLGLRDYMEKTNSNGFVVSLSGGADSTACAILVAKTIEFDLKNKNIKFDKKYIKDKLTCIYQSTNNSSETTFNAAKKVANELGAKFKNIDIQSIVDLYVNQFSKDEWNLNWENDDTTLQNIQARTRAPGIWLIANKENKILISTSNRSEAAVGYATMDGDTCGGIAPIAGISKDFLIEWLKWMMEYNNMPFLHYVIDQKPTAELRPLEKTQTDEEDLMPYDILDRIERIFVQGKRGPKVIFGTLKQLYPKTDNKILFEYLKKFLILWPRNQWKRERYAPAFHLDDYNLDPKTGCRFPILSSKKAFIEELNELEKDL